MGLAGRFLYKYAVSLTEDRLETLVKTDSFLLKEEKQLIRICQILKCLF